MFLRNTRQLTASITIQTQEKESQQQTKRKLVKRKLEELELSDKVLYGDLLRFNKLDDFKPVDPSKYMYGKDRFKVIWLM